MIAALAWTGTTLVLSRVRWFAREPLTERLAPFHPRADRDASRRGLLSVDSFRDVVGPLVSTGGALIARAFGTSENLEPRLRRIHSPIDPTVYRLRQALATLITFLLAAAVVAMSGAGPAVGTLALVGSPLLVFLVLEDRVARASAAWQHRVFLELPVVAEQLAMLLSAGYSLGGAIRRLADRGHGACAIDLKLVLARMTQGVTEIDALREWAEIVDVRELDRLVSVLSLNREAGDLGRLIAEEARSTRREVQRRTMETIDRRGQQVWIPVTVATLLPGVIFIAIPFIEAMRLFTNP